MADIMTYADRIDGSRPIRTPRMTILGRLSTGGKLSGSERAALRRAAEGSQPPSLARLDKNAAASLLELDSRLRPRASA